MVERIKHIITKRKMACYIGLLCLIVLILSTKEITNENVLSMNGDMPRYLMNGVYLHDLLDDLPVKNPIKHACRYFAKYPALSLGHHPMLPAFAEVPFYKLFGISVFSGRLMTVCFMLLGAIVWFLFIRSLYDETIAIISSLLFVTAPIIVQYSRIVMSEIPTLSLILLSMYLLNKYCQSEKAIYFFAFAISFTISIYSKHTAVFMIPVYFAYFVVNKRFKSLFSREVVLSVILIAVLLGPLIPITLTFSQIDLGVVQQPISTKFNVNLWIRNIQNVWSHQLTWPVIILSLISILYSSHKRNKLSLLFLLWIVLCYFLVVCIHKVNPRYSIYWVPPFCLFAATIYNIVSRRKWKVSILVVLIMAIGYQFVEAYNKSNEYVYGYEAAAKYIVENKKGESVLYSSVYDTGYFIFFIRKHDHNRDSIVLRADKLFATSFMDRIVEDRITESKEIYDVLRGFGVNYIVIEDTKALSEGLELFRKEVKSSPHFVLVKQIVLRSHLNYINNVALSIYEYKNYLPVKESKVIDMKIPMMGDSIRIPFEELQKNNP
jgi:hypothetical protein